MKTNNIFLLKLTKLVVALPKYFFVQRKFKKIKIHTDLETVKRLQDGQTSISRFGDGEFDWMTGKGQENGFQKNNPRLALMLKGILDSGENDHFIIGLPRQLKTIRNENFLNLYFWVRAIKARGLVWYDFLNQNTNYWSSTFSRPYMGMRNKKNTRMIFEESKRILQDRDVIIIEGSGTRFGLGTNLLNRAKSVQRILAPSENAFDKYEIIKKSVLQQVRMFEKPLVLISLGPTATVLAWELSAFGVQAIDIGHLDMEYYWYSKGATQPIDIEWKYMNEIHNGKQIMVSPPGLEKYKSEIIDVIK